MVRLGCSFLSQDLGVGWATLPARVARFPALAGCTITVVVWWAVLVPLIHHMLCDNTKQLAAFWRFNGSFVLVNIHLLNLPLAAAEFFLADSPLGYFDLYCGLFVALVYLLWYGLVCHGTPCPHLSRTIIPRPKYSLINPLSDAIATTTPSGTCWSLMPMVHTSISY
jgi:hypothetical protein